ncbi:response regulator [Alkalitalea saponilacus]|uniref:Response regulator receiver domain-containing protein n=1 Tax=Alkalitalea saponilacus TaxID=889453 RepID=A0A1T5HS95_9BACT|nr:response regulator [Alkalitalea saponilacus]SKC23564.1 Response regulator receiver domain-containing protein [Alkalitalea saponilacus]
MKINEDYILIVDDSQTNNVLLEAVLAEEDYPTQTAMSATEAWNLIYKQQPALILLDLLMPKISGFHLLERLKSKEIYGKIPVIIVSALNDPDTIRVLKEMGADDFFTKPLNIQGLLKRVAQLYPRQEAV